MRFSTTILYVSLLASSNNLETVRRFLLSSHAAPSALALVTCNCEYSKIWNDIMFLFDSSGSSTNEGLQDMLASVQSAFAWLNLQNSSCTDPHHTRIGIATFAREAHLLYELGSLDNEKLESIPELPYDGDEVADIEKAIRLANQQFESQAHRRNARRVIFLLATSYNPDGFDSPQTIAAEFRQNGGVFVVYNYQQVHGIASPMLQELASPGYFIANYLDSQGSMTLNAMCNANCFCPPNHSSYSNDPSNNVPLDGCYSGSGTESSLQISENVCEQLNGQLALDDSEEKAKFLQNQMVVKANFWTPVTFNSANRRWQWPNGNPVSSYQPWYKGLNYTTGYNCAFVEKNTLSWVPVDCRKGFVYVCQKAPCDSRHYCT